MKVINKYECLMKDKNEILTEISILKKIDHPNILKLFEFYSNKDSYSMIIELCPGGELYKEII